MQREQSPIVKLAKLIDYADWTYGLGVDRRELEKLIVLVPEEVINVTNVLILPSLVSEAENRHGQIVLITIAQLLHQCHKFIPVLLKLIYRLQYFVRILICHCAYLINQVFKLLILT